MQVFVSNERIAEMYLVPIIMNRGIREKTEEKGIGNVGKTAP